MQSKASNLSKPKDGSNTSGAGYVDAFIASPYKWLEACDHALKIKKIADRYHPHSRRLERAIIQLLAVMQEMHGGPLPGQ